MVAPTVRALDLKIIDIIDGLRIAEDVVFASANVAAEQITEFPSVFTYVQHDLRGAENVAGVPKSDRHTIKHREGAIVIDPNKLAHRLFSIRMRVKGFDRRQPMFRAFFRNERGV